jgi:hypothetical protein
MLRQDDPTLRHPDSKRKRALGERPWNGGGEIPPPYSSRGWINLAFPTGFSSMEEYTLRGGASGVSATSRCREFCLCGWEYLPEDPSGAWINFDFYHKFLFYDGGEFCWSVSAFQYASEALNTLQCAWSSILASRSSSSPEELFSSSLLRCVVFTVGDNFVCAGAVSFVIIPALDAGTEGWKVEIEYVFH